MPSSLDCFIHCSSACIGCASCRHLRRQGLTLAPLLGVLSCWVRPKNNRTCCRSWYGRCKGKAGPDNPGARPGGLAAEASRSFACHLPQNVGLTCLAVLTASISAARSACTFCCHSCSTDASPLSCCSCSLAARPALTWVSSSAVNCCMLSVSSFTCCQREEMGSEARWQRVGAPVR